MTWVRPLAFAVIVPACLALVECAYQAREDWYRRRELPWPIVAGFLGLATAFAGVFELGPRHESLHGVALALGGFSEGLHRRMGDRLLSAAMGHRKVSDSPSLRKLLNLAWPASLVVLGVLSRQHPLILVAFASSGLLFGVARFVSRPALTWLAGATLLLAGVALLLH